MASAARPYHHFVHGHPYPPQASTPFAFNGRHYNNMQSSSMLSTPTFFDDTFFPNENIPDDGSGAHQQMSAFSFRPLSPVTHAAQSSPRVSRKIDSHLLKPIPVPGILNEPVDASAYSPVGEEELAQADLEYDDCSSASLDSHTAGPYTPLTDAGSTYSDGHSYILDRNALGAHCYNEFQIYVSRHGHPMDNSLHSLQSVAFKQNHLAVWNGQSCSAPASLPASHLTFHPSPRVSSSMSEHQPGQAFSDFRPTNQYSVPFARPIESGYMLPTNGLSHSVSSTSTGWSHDFSVRELDTSDTNVDSDSGEDDQEYDRNAPPASIPSDHSELEGLKQRQDRDALLLKLRSQGIAYKAIKRRGGFQEAESTLRGRVRMLTKEKSERVRKPVWTPKDISLLHRAFHAFSEHHTSVKIRNPHKIPWKKVSEYITDNGGTYHFAAATCAKKWDDIVRRR